MVVLVVGAVGSPAAAAHGGASVAVKGGPGGVFSGRMATAANRNVSVAEGFLYR